MRELTVSEMEMVSGGGLLAEIGKAFVIEAVIGGAKALGSALFEYSKTAPPQVFERERCMLK